MTTNFDAISDNANDFASALLALADYAEASVETVIRKACIDLYKMIVERTPIDTGRAKASWSLGIDHGEDKADDEDGYSFNEISSIIQDNVSEFKFGIHDDQVVIYNNMEYIEQLENGTSQQAPSGMVSISLADFTTFFNNALQDLDGVE